MNENENMSNSIENEDVEGDNQEVKSFSEAEVNELLQRETDRRVSAALKKQEQKLSRKLAEADKLRNMDEAERKEYEFEQRLREFEEERKEFTLAQNKLEAAKVLSNRGLPIEFVDYIVAEDAEDMMHNITTFETLFKAAVNDAVSAKIASPTPKSGATQIGIDKAGFAKLSLMEQQEIYRSNPELYKKLVG